MNELCRLVVVGVISKTHVWKKNLEETGRRNMFMFNFQSKSTDFRVEVCLQWGWERAELIFIHVRSPDVMTFALSFLFPQTFTSVTAAGSLTWSVIT